MHTEHAVFSTPRRAAALLACLFSSSSPRSPPRGATWSLSPCQLAAMKPEKPLCRAAATQHNSHSTIPRQPLGSHSAPERTVNGIESSTESVFFNVLLLNRRDFDVRNSDTEVNVLVVFSRCKHSKFFFFFFRFLKAKSQQSAETNQFINGTNAPLRGGMRRRQV